MTREEGASQTFAIPEQVVTEALTTSLKPEIAVPIQPEPAAVEVLDPAEQQRNRRHVMSRIAAGLVLGGTLLVGMAGRAEAAPTETVASQSQESDINWTTVATVAAVGVTAVSVVTGAIVSSATLRNSTREKREDRFGKALGDIKGDSTGDERLNRLLSVEYFAEHDSYKRWVNKAGITYLRGRRSSLETLKEKYEDNPKKLNKALDERRNADRGALKLVNDTLDPVRERAQKEMTINRIRRFFGVRTEIEKLAKKTGIYQEKPLPLVNARGISLDEMRDVSGYDLHNLDLTGAGLQRNQITNVSFRNSRMQEVQLDGTIIASSNLEGTDMRAAYFEGATIENCPIDKDTRLGNLPDNHPKARVGGLDLDRADQYRGDGRVIIKNLISDTLTEAEIVEKVKEWQRGGITLLEGSNPEYFIDGTQLALF